MPLTCNEIGKLVTRIQADFLENPGVRLTPDEAERWFRIDRLTCAAILAALADANVLTLDAAGRYRRHVPAGNHGSAHNPLMAASSANGVRWGVSLQRP